MGISARQWFGAIKAAIVCEADNRPVCWIRLVDNRWITCEYRMD